MHPAQLEDDLQEPAGGQAPVDVGLHDVDDETFQDIDDEMAARVALKRHGLKRPCKCEDIKGYFRRRHGRPKGRRNAKRMAESPRSATPFTVPRQQEIRSGYVCP